MSNVDQYLEAATRENTRRSYKSALAHFEVEWGGFLPASAESVAQYLANYGGVLAISTLRHRLAALAQWHQENGFADPTRAHRVRKTLRGIQALHPSAIKQAVPVQIEQLARLNDALLVIAAGPTTGRKQGERERATRDRALILLGFWRAFRSDEITRLRVEHLKIESGVAMECFLPRSKGDRTSQGRTFTVPALSRLCPVAACEAWLSLSGLSSGPVFRSVDRWGHIGKTGLHVSSITPLLRRAFYAAGIGDGVALGSHSLRRGFAGWAATNGWDVRSLMEYVGWQDMKSAVRYLDGHAHEIKERMEAGLAAKS
ncbi:integrase [Silvimonas terrae]|uniref:Integrase n=1 Tax=Silvimonas terrae TaxID=300266 RepID=A0A840RB87_9NEIS|nr:site-specific integrase [Silvimonas terrae]MBB5190689.1 integrase [Silvimonas terrae]